MSEQFDPASILTDDEKASIVAQRAKQFAADAYGHQLNRADALAENPNADTKELDEALAILGKRVEGAVAKIDELVAAESVKVEAVDVGAFVD